MSSVQSEALITQYILVLAADILTSSAGNLAPSVALDTLNL